MTMKCLYEEGRIGQLLKSEYDETTPLPAIAIFTVAVSIFSLVMHLYLYIYIYIQLRNNLDIYILTDDMADVPFTPGNYLRMYDEELEKIKNLYADDVEGKYFKEVLARWAKEGR